MLGGCGEFGWCFGGGEWLSGFGGGMASYRFVELEFGLEFTVCFGSAAGLAEAAACYLERLLVPLPGTW